MECQKEQTKPIIIMELNIDNRTAYLIHRAPVIHACGPIIKYIYGAPW